MPGRYGRVRGKHYFARNSSHRLVEIQAFFLHATADGLEDGKAAVAFIQVENPRSDAHRLQRTKAADAQQQLLADPDAPVSAVQSGRELPVLWSVAWHIRIEQ